MNTPEPKERAGAGGCSREAPCSAVVKVMMLIAKEVGATSVTIANREAEVPYEPPQMADYRRECAERNSQLLRVMKRIHDECAAETPKTT